MGTQASKEGTDGPRRRIQFNDERCIWCRSCELICSLSHEGECNPSLSRIRISLNVFDAAVGASVCRQCDDPECVEACPVGAIKSDEATGAFYVSADECTACGSCAEACPFNQEGNIIFLNPARNVYVKCDLCRGSPQCVEICASKALTHVAD